MPALLRLSFDSKRLLLSRSQLGFWVYAIGVTLEFFRLSEPKDSGYNKAFNSKLGQNVCGHPTLAAEALRQKEDRSAAPASHHKDQAGCAR